MRLSDRLLLERVGGRYVLMEELSTTGRCTRIGDAYISELTVGYEIELSATEAGRLAVGLAWFASSDSALARVIETRGETAP